jgi:hypothetical protein
VVRAAVERAGGARVEAKGVATVGVGKVEGEKAVAAKVAVVMVVVRVVGKVAAARVVGANIPWAASEAEAVVVTA